ncbi:MAG: hypothetical protein WA677_09540 [Bradyrhizobium sp.]
MSLEVAQFEISSGHLFEPYRAHETGYNLPLIIDPLAASGSICAPPAEGSDAGAKQSPDIDVLCSMKSSDLFLGVFAIIASPVMAEGTSLGHGDAHRSRARKGDRRLPSSMDKRAAKIKYVARTYSNPRHGKCGLDASRGNHAIQALHARNRRTGRRHQDGSPGGYERRFHGRAGLPY